MTTFLENYFLSLIFLVAVSICYLLLPSSPFKRFFSFLLVFSDSFSLYTFSWIRFYKFFSLKSGFIFLRSNKNFRFMILIAFLAFIIGMINSHSIEPIFESSLSFNSPYIKVLRNTVTIVFYLFAAAFLVRSKAISEVFNPNGYAVLGFTIISFMFVLLEFLFSIDSFHTLTGGFTLTYGIHYDRVRGMFYEPRGLVLMNLISLLISIHFTKTKIKWLTFIFVMPQLYLAFSLSGFVILFAITFFYFLISLCTKQPKKVIIESLAFLLISISFTMFSYNFDTVRSNHSYEGRQYFFKGSRYVDKNFLLELQKGDYLKLIEKSPDNFLFNEVISRLEITDSSYAHFLYKNPKYLFFGTGPALSSFYSRRYILEKDILYHPNGFQTIPHMGFFYFLSQYGLVLTLFMLYPVFLIIKKGTFNERIFFISLILISSLQVRYTNILLPGVTLYLLEKYKIEAYKFSLFHSKTKKQVLA